MRFVTFSVEDNVHIGVLNEACDKVIDLHKAEQKMKNRLSFPPTLVECIQLGDRFIDDVKELLEWDSDKEESDVVYSLEKVKLLAPIPSPLKNIFCLGKNYAAHAIEMGSEVEKDYPIVFSKTKTTVIGPNETVLHHQHVTKELDYEGEIALIIGKKGKGIKKEEAYDYIFGYTIINDVTARDLQRRHQQFLLGKSLDTFCPMGPWITHASLIENPANLHLETKVNGEVRQSANTNQLIFDIPTIIETLSLGMTLEPGDIIATGTPAGVGSGFNPPKHLHPGDVVEITVSQLGTLTNPIEK